MFENIKDMMDKLKDMKAVLYVVFFFINFTAFACSPVLLSYYEKEGKVYFGRAYRDNDPDKKEVLGVDVLSFSINEESRIYAKDKNFVYYNGEILKGANPDAFVFLGGVNTIAGIEGYSKDEKNVFFENKRVDSVDVNSFEVIDYVYNFASRYEDGYAKDKNHVFRYGSILEYDPDPNTFKVLGWMYTLDKSGIYHNSKLLKGANPNDYWQKQIFLVSNNMVYFTGIKIPEYDVASFKILDITISVATSCGGIGGIAVLTQDNKGIYLDNDLLDWLDATTFKQDSRQLISDKNGLYEFKLGLYGKESRFEKLSP